MRLFELTLLVYAPEDEPLPASARDWLTLATGIDCSEGPALSTVLESVHERRYPLAADVVERRKHDRGTTFLYG